MKTEDWISVKLICRKFQTARFGAKMFGFMMRNTDSNKGILQLMGYGMS